MAETLGCKSLIATGVVLGAFVWPSSAALAKDWFPYPVEQWDPPFDMGSPRKAVEDTPLPKASKIWSICVSFPHMKDAYWMGVDYGVVSAVGVFYLVPSLILYIAAQRYLMQMSIGGVKG